jgi:hypothetical protein
MPKLKIKYRAVIKLLTLEGQSVSDIYHRMLVGYDKMSFLREIVFQWVSEVKDDRIDLQTYHPS